MYARGMRRANSNFLWQQLKLPCREFPQQLKRQHRARLRGRSVLAAVTDAVAASWQLLQSWNA